MKWIIWILVLRSSFCFGQSKLEGTEFSDGEVFVSSESYGWSWSYKFDRNQYELYLYYHYETPKSYLFEEGDYSCTNKEVVLTPMKKIICEIEGLTRFDCMTALGPEEGFTVSKDSLSEREIADLGFTNRVCFISNESDKLKLSDPSKPFAQFRQLVKE
ncbi:MAG: hypothetical protein M3R25_04525 [Bacteroidota bacterium]|nr:hypothetical protein [Bacteroidota bacterium]